MAKESVVERAKRNRRVAVEAWAAQLEREIAALRMQVPSEQWTPEARASRGGGDVPGSPIPATPKPMLSIDKLNQPVRLIVNQQQQAQLGINVHAISELANDEDAKVKQGVYRSIERISNAPVVRNWSFERAVKAGRGAYQVVTRYCKGEGLRQFDQEMIIKRLLYQEAALFDPSAQEPDFRDGEYAFVSEWMPLSTFRRRWPKADIPTDDGEFNDLARNEPLWVRGDGDNKAVLVATYYEKEHKEETIVLLPDGNVVPEDDVPPGTPTEDLPTRKVDKVTVKCYTIAPGSTEPLEEYEWMGQYIPLIPVIGDELQPYDQHRRFMGLVERAMDAQRTFNYAISQAVLMTALEPNAPWLIEEGQIEGYEDMWQQSATRNLTALIYKGTTIGDKPAPPPQRTPVDASRLGPSMMLVQESDKLIQSATAIFDPSLGNLSQKERSGKAILALQGQGDAGTSQYLYNLAQISMRYEAEVILDAMPYYYDRPGRVEQILNEKDEEETVMLNAPYVMDPQTKRPRRLSDEQMPEGAKFHRLSRGTYNVSVTVGKSWQTRLQQGADEIGQVIQAIPPEAATLILPLYFKYRDFPGAKEISDLLQKAQDIAMPGLKEDKTMTPEKAQAQLQAATTENQQLKQLLTQATQALETEQAKQMAMLKKAEIDAAVKAEVAKIQADSGMAKETLDSATAVELQRMKNEIEMLKLRMQQQQQEDQQAHERGMAGAQAGMSAVEGERGREFEAGESERDRQTAAEQADADRKAAEKQAKAKETKD